MPLFSSRSTKKRAVTFDRKIIANNATAHHITPQKNQSTGLWLYVSGWGEGIANWRKTLSDILFVAKKLNCFVVEPCVQNGRLVSCESGGGLLRVGAIFNLSRHDSIVSFSDFQIQTKNATVFSSCMTYAPAAKLCQGAPNAFKKQKSDMLERAIMMAKTRATVLESVQIWKGAFDNLKYKGTLLAPPHEVRKVRDALDFRKEHYNHVDSLLSKLGATKSFAVIHWRAERRRGMDYEKCTQAILRARKAMNMPNESFILMSSLNMNRNLQWAGVQHLTEGGKESISALQRFFDAGFLKQDQLGEKVMDQILLAVYELIILIKASKFATCKPGCRSVCSNCNFHGSNFAQFYLELRGKV
jgi:hypothetical protein